MVNLCNRIIEYSFYGLFLFVPLAFTSATSELFELNKMWLTWALTITIGTSWFVKMILQKKFFIQRTPLDIPIALFLLSQIISTIFSQDVHVSLWGYYSRFNGGLLSIVSYILLYYAFVSNFTITNADNAQEKRESVREFREKIRDFSKTNAISMVKRLLSISLLSGLVVALWGLPSHFGYDPTCFIFRGNFDVSCWTADFMPRVRIFSTLGQPNWLAAYLAILIPIAIAYFLNSFQSQKILHEKLQTVNSKLQKHNSNFKFPMYIFYLLFTILFYLDLLYTRARSGILGIWISLIFFFAAYFWIQRKKLNFSFLTSPPAKAWHWRAGHLSLLIGLLLLITFVIGTPINQLHQFTLEGIGRYFQKPATTPSNGADAETRKQSGGTESADIRLNVWPGAINAWRANPLFGTGVETFAFAYYKYKPAGQNLTSEWNFLYNKAHNEYLNYLATTGIVGLGSYLLMIGYFLFLAFKKISKSEFLISNQIPNSKSQLGQLEIRSIRNLSFALLASYISILVTNFFSFSVVITNIYLFMIPAFIFVLGGMLSRNESGINNHESRNLYQWTFIFFIILASIFMILNLFRFWQADIAYALGYNLNRAGEYQEAYKNLHKAVELRGDEPVLKDELSINDAIIATSLISQNISENTDQAAKEKTQTIASSLTQEAINTSNEVVSKYPNNAVFWKTRTRVFYTLSQVDSRYLPFAVEAIEKASILAPNDANIWYNLGVLYGQNNNITKGIEALEKTVKLKPDYRDAYYALGIYYNQKAIDKDGRVTNPDSQKKAIAQMQYILDHLNPQDTQALESIKNWGQ